MKIQAHVYFSGIVQGVGFRYTTERFASNLGLVGWAKNLSDGRVEMMAQGSQNKVEELIKQLELHFSGSIQHTDVSYTSVVEKFNNFCVMRVWI